MELVFLLCCLLSWSLAQEDPGEEPPTRPPFVPPPRPSGDVYFAESFSDGEDAIWKRWVMSEATKDGADDDVAKYNGKWVLEELSTEGVLDGDVGLIMKESAKHYAVAAKLDRPFTFEGVDGFLVQYEVNFQNGLSCGGAYIKLLSTDASGDLAQFQDKTPYSIMFGPDKCGMSSKIHFIVRLKNPVTGEIEEKHSKQAEGGNMEFFNDKKTHLFTLLIHSTGEYHVIVDQMPFLKGSLTEDMTPPFVPPAEIDDPDDSRPEDWDEREKIEDPEAVKPDEWDDDAPPKIPDPNAVKPDGWMDDGPEFIADPDAMTPDDWDEEEDGEWEPPMISNPVCDEVGCGQWEAPMIQNPNYRGKWKPELIENAEYDGKWVPRQIPNPAYFDDTTPFFSLTPIGAVGFELWSMNEDIYFDNILVASELTIANNYARDGWRLKYANEIAVSGSFSVSPWIDMFVEVANERPYLWALYAVAIVSPFVLIAACCVKSKPKPKDEAAERKKTDAPSPDDPVPPEKESSDGTEEEKSFIAAADDDEEEGQGDRKSVV